MWPFPSGGKIEELFCPNSIPHTSLQPAVSWSWPSLRFEPLFGGVKSSRSLKTNGDTKCRKTLVRAQAEALLRMQWCCAPCTICAAGKETTPTHNPRYMLMHVLASKALLANWLPNPKPFRLHGRRLGLQGLEFVFSCHEPQQG